MCNHIFIYPEDKKVNYNLDGKTLTGRCKCGVEQTAYGMIWSIQEEEKKSAHKNDLSGQQRNERDNLSY